MQAFGAWIVRIFAGLILDRILVLAKSVIEVWVTRKEIKARAEESVKKMREAKTGKEISEATKDTLDGI